jgi:mono/diheme cytochrome c family protein
MFRYLAVASLLVALFASQVFSADGLAPPTGYKPDKKTIRLFEAKCATCHGEDGRAKTELGQEMAIADMTRAAYWKDLTLESARKSVMDGIKRTSKGLDGKEAGKEQEMKPFRDRLTPEQIDALDLYASSFKK